MALALTLSTLVVIAADLSEVLSVQRRQLPDTSAPSPWSRLGVTHAAFRSSCWALRFVFAALGSPSWNACQGVRPFMRRPWCGRFRL